MKSVKFYTVGCKVNQYDTQEIREQFLEAGLVEAKAKQKADIYVINTCTVTAKADKDSFYYIHRSHRENPEARIIVTGCLAGLDRKKIAYQPGVSLIIPNSDKSKIVSKIIGDYSKPGKGITFFAGRTRVFMKVQDGCNNFCSYCRVPLARGVSRSRNLAEVIREAENLVEKGFKEIVLTGICLGSFGRDLRPQRSLVDIITALEGINGLLRIRLSSIEARDVTEELIAKMAISSKLCRHLHIPIQSGDDQILQKMCRKYSRDDYLSLIKEVKKRVPEVAITTDVLVGFPQEQKENFLNTIDLVKKITPLRTHIFPFSPRPQTAAYGYTPRIQECVVKERVSRLRLVAESCGLAYQKKSLGKKLPVLFEARCPENNGYWEGYTDTYIKVLVKSTRDLKNQLVPVKLTKITPQGVLSVFLGNLP
jgi:threonylcarbamoyladenosine tRNA methylthiotransferase MtaB